MSEEILILGFPLILFIMLTIPPIALFIESGLFFVWYHWFIPPDAKDLIHSRNNKRLGDILLFSCGEEGRARFFLGKPLSQGVLNIGTELNPKYLFLPRSIEVPKVPVLPSLSALLEGERKTKEDQGQEFTQEDENKIIEGYRNASVSIEQRKEDQNQYGRTQDLVLFRHFLEGLGRPVYIVYMSKAVAITPAALAALDFPLPTKGQTSIWGKFASLVPKRTIVKRDGTVGTEQLSDIEILFGLPIDPRIVKQIVPQNYTQSQIDMVKTDAYMKGLRQGQIGQNKFIVPLIIFGLIMIGAVVVLKVLGVF
jgi:hypothetical protein